MLKEERERDSLYIYIYTYVGCMNDMKIQTFPSLEKN